MKSHRLAAWSLLGSDLWLRPVESGDLGRLEAFWERRDLVRSAGPGGTTLPTMVRLARGKGGLRRWSPRKGIVLVAVDLLGAPAGVFSLDPDPEPKPDRAAVSFTVPRDGAAVLHEALRLLADAAGHRTPLRRLVVRAAPAAPALDLLLRGTGWTREGEGVWTLDFAADPEPVTNPRPRRPSSRGSAPRRKRAVRSPGGRDEN